MKRGNGVGLITEAHRDERGLTAIELAVVVAILAILAALVSSNASGLNTTARAATQTSDVAEVQKALDRYSAEHPSGGYPTASGSPPSLGSTAAISFTASFQNSDGATKTFVPDYVKRNPKHASDSWWTVDYTGTVTVAVPSGSVY
ncbi:MAG: prepilin-type N-terminal cleavage/methylation domain-containing protein [Chloroflexi bacterium]|nr:prepilin-type N-terminal cleavage/methylation domain-containing protein [Chloroflexota bacterium]